MDYKLNQVSKHEVSKDSNWFLQESEVKFLTVNSKPAVCVRNGNSLEIYEKSGGSWQQAHAKKDFFQGIPTRSALYPWSVHQDNGKYVVSKRDDNGQHVYRIDGANFAQLDNDAAKILTKSDGYETEGKSVIQMDKSLVVAENDEQLTMIFKLNVASATIFDFLHSEAEKENWMICEGRIVSLSAGVATVYKVNDNDITEEIELTVSAEPTDNAKILLLDDTLLHINDRGLDVYSTKTKQQLAYFNEFASFRGWRQSHLDSGFVSENLFKGKKALVFNGPKGIEAFVIGESGKTFNANLVLLAQHGTALGEAAGELIAYNKNMLQSFTVQESPKKSSTSLLPVEDTDGKLQIDYSKTSPKIETAPMSPTILWLHEVLDEGRFKDVIDKRTGKLSLSFAIVDLSERTGLPIRQAMYFEDVDKEEQSVLGRYWTFGKDCIIVDRKDSIFAHDHEYFLVKDTTRFKLTHISTVGKVQHFEIVGAAQLKITYDETKGSWEAWNEDVKYVYGKHGELDGVSYTPGWDDWMGPSGNYASAKGIAVQWSLVKMESKINADNFLKYSYEKESQESNKHTEAIYLTKIDDGFGTTVSFQYETGHRPAEEPPTPPYLKRFHFQDTKLLKSISVKTPSFYQNLLFTYKKIDELSYLQGIAQEGQQVLGFEFVKKYERQRLAKISLPSKSDIQYTYGRVALRPQTFTKTEHGGTTYHTGPGYSFRVVQTTKRHCQFTVMDLAARDDMLANQDLTVPTVDHDIKGISPTLHSSYIVANMNIDGNGSMLVFYFRNPKNDWDVKGVTHHVADMEGFKINFADQHVLYYAAGKLVKLSMDFKGKKLHQTDVTIGPVDCFKFINGGAVYHQQGKVTLKRFTTDTGSVVTHEFPTGSKHWSLTDGVNSILAGVILHPDESFNDAEKKKKADEELEKYKKDLHTNFASNALALYNNLVVFRTVRLEDGILRSQVFVYSLDNAYKPTLQKEFDIAGDTLETFRITMQAWDVYDFVWKNYTFHFVKQSNGKYEVNVLKMEAIYEGKPTENYDKANQKNLNNIYSKMIKLPLDFEKYFMHVSEHMILYSDHRIYHNGDVRNIATAPVDRDLTKMDKMDVRMGESLRLEKKSSAANVMLYHKQAFLYDFGTPLAKNISVQYPCYILNQRKNDLHVVKLDATGRQVSTYKIPDETPHASSSAALLVTTNKAKQTVVRPGAILEESPQVVVIVQESVTTAIDRETYSTRYQFIPDKATISYNEVQFKEVQVIPGASQEGEHPYGYYHEMTNFVTSAQTVQVYDAQDKLFDPQYFQRLQDHQREEKKENEDPKDDPETVIYDRNRNLRIVQIAPFQTKDNVVLYLGFEDYENTNGWTGFQVIRNQFPATGRNYAVVSSGAPLSRSFELNSAIGTFVASAWLRTQQPLKEGVETELLKVTVSGRGYQGKVLQQIEDWWYVEATFSIEQQRNINVNIAIKSAGNDLHVDHVRFSPLDFNFVANVYDSVTARRVASIHANGFVTRFEFDHFGKRALELSETNNIKFLSTYTKRFASCSGHPVLQISLSPKIGIYERFSPYTVKNYWNIPANFKVVPGRVIAVGSGTIELKRELQFDVVAVRVVCTNLKRNLKIALGRAVETIESSSVRSGYGEVLVLFTSTFITVLINGCIVKESKQSLPIKNQKLQLIVDDGTILENLVLMQEPEVTVGYMNGNNKPTQEILLKDVNALAVRENIYDKLGRKVLETIWTKVLVKDARTIFKFHTDFVRNRIIPSGSFQIEGVVSSNNQEFNGYPFQCYQYANNPLEIREKVGQPGQKYSIDGPFATKFTIESTVPYIKFRYGKDQGYRTEEEHKPDGAIHVAVYNRRHKKVADFVKVRDFNDILTTYEYDDDGNQVQMLPPMYHKKVNSLLQKSYEGIQALMSERTESVQWENRAFYKDKLLMNRTTPDAGLVEFFYNAQKQLSFQLHTGKDRKVDKMLYFVYNPFGKLRGLGTLEATYEQQVRRNHFDTNPLPPCINCMTFDYGETEEDPALRGRLMRVVKQNQQTALDEVLLFDENENVIRKSYVSPANQQSLSVEYLYENDKVVGIMYPIGIDNRTLELTYQHNLRGEVIAVKDGLDEKKIFATLEHNSQGKVTAINHPLSSADLIQRFKYNEPGFLTQVENKYLKEDLDYETGGYGAKARGDGSMLRTSFEARWHDHCDQSLVPLRVEHFVKDGVMDKPLARLCYAELQRLKYLDTNGRPLRTFYPELHVDLSLKCSTEEYGEHISRVLLTKGFPQTYGHMYNFGSHGELTEAKGFLGGDTWKDLNKEFGETLKTSANWNGLRDIITGLKSKRSYFANLPEQDRDLKHLIPRYLEALILTPDVARNIENICALALESKKASCSSALPKYTNYKQFLDAKLQSQSADKLKELFTYLRDTFATGIGRSPADVESFSIDQNGNHRLFYTGFKRFELAYKEHSNQIDYILANFSQRNRKQVLHDSEGNIVKAEHKNIERIEYDPLSQRVSKIVMSDNKVLEFSYNYKGERTIKRVRSAKGQLIREIFYVRDHKGNTLVEYKFEFPNASRTEKPIITETAYIYGPIGLLGFYRNNQYYSVLQDHEGSTRLIVKDDQVVAAYDYLPYGQLLRSFGNDEDAHISYRFTGQEYDEETGLYNYHARLYDPDIGRFYQCDPQEQYPSPYKYAGNSPVSQVDPDGEFAFTVSMLIVAAFVGAYLGASAANKSWNPASWDWKNKWTWINMIIGGMMGAFTLIGGIASVSYIAAMFGGSYLAGTLATGALAVAGAMLGASAATGEWNPAKWDWSSPLVWNGLLTGVSVAVNIPSGIVGVTRTFYTLVTTMSKTIYAAFLATSFLLLGYVGGAMANNFDFRPDHWDWKNPKTLFSIIEGASTAFMASSATVRHGAKQTLYVVKPNNLPATWYRIQVPKTSFIIKEKQFSTVIKYYSYGRYIGTKTVPLTRLGVPYRLPQYIGTSTARFTSMTRQVMAHLLTAQLIIVRDQYFKALYERNATTAVTPTEGKSRRRRTTFDNDRWYTSGSNGFGFDFLKRIYKFFEDTVAPQMPQGHTTPRTVGFPVQPNERPSVPFERYCIALDGDDSAFQCPSGHSTINVFSKDAKFTATSFGQDSYGHCTPLHWNDRPSVSCTGEQSTFIYTPTETARIFDWVDGWLMLARITPAVIGSVKHGLHYLIHGKPKETDIVEDVARLKQPLLRQLDSIQKHLQQVQKGARLSWAAVELTELRYDVEEFLASKTPTNGELGLLSERLQALREDIAEVTQIEAYNDQIAMGKNDVGAIDFAELLGSTVATHDRNVAIGSFEQLTKFGNFIM